MGPPVAKPGSKKEIERTCARDSEALGSATKAITLFLFNAFRSCPYRFSKVTIISFGNLELRQRIQKVLAFSEVSAHTNGMLGICEDNTGS